MRLYRVFDYHFGEDHADILAKSPSKAVESRFGPCKRGDRSRFDYIAVEIDEQGNEKQFANTYYYERVNK